MLTKDTLELLQKADLQSKIDNQVGFAIENGIPFVVMPEGIEVKNIERYLPRLQRFEGTYKTSSIANFADYLKAMDQESTRVFVDDLSMQAMAILDFVTVTGDALHCANKAVLTAKRKAEYAALLNFTGERHSQKDFAEFMEDYADNIKCFDADGQPIQLVKAIAAVRRIEVNATARATSEVQSFNTERSALESMSINDSNKLPSLIVFRCKPYAEFNEFNFEIRPAVITGETVKLTARMVRKEEVREEIAQHFCELIESSFYGKGLSAPISIGSFSN